MRSRFVLAAAVVFLAAGPVPAAGLDAVAVDAVIEPDSGTITATARVTVSPPAGTETVEVLLNRRLEITEVGADVAITGFEHRRQGDGPYLYAPQATPLRLRLAVPASGEPIELRLAYRGAVEPDPYGVVGVSADRVELVAAYSAWVPFDPGAQGFSASLRARLPAGWKAAGTGSPRLEGGSWISAAGGVRDLVFLASPHLQSINAGPSLSVIHSNLPKGVPERIAADAQAVRETFTSWFGPASGGHVDLVFAERESGGGYARPGLVVMLYQGAYDDGADAGPSFIRYLAHEVSHLWWQGAPTTDWQDWLNESFAEMSALMMLRHRFGEEVFDRTLERYRELSSDLPPVRGIARDEEAAYAVLYRKGPVILADLESRVGRGAFLRFLRARVAEGVVTTDGCLETLQQTVSADARTWLEAALDR